MDTDQSKLSKSFKIYILIYLTFALLALLMGIGFKWVQVLQSNLMEKRRLPDYAY